MTAPAHVVRLTPDRRRFGVVDLRAGAWTTLVDDQLNAWPVEFHTRTAAEAWLRRCYREWGWTPPPPETSPFELEPWQ